MRSENGVHVPPSAPFAVDPGEPNTICIGKYYGVEKSTDGGANLSVVNDYYDVFAILIAPSAPHTIYLAAYSDDPTWGCESNERAPCGVLKSTTGGASWVHADTGLPQHVTALALDPIAPGTLYAAAAVSPTAGAILYKTPNAGLPVTDVKALVADPTTAGALYAAEADRVFMTANGGTTWTALDAGLDPVEVNRLAFDPTLPKTLYAATGAGIWDYELASVPTITGVSPGSAAAGGAGFTLTVTGTNFVALSQVLLGSQPLTTTFVSSTTLTAAVPASAISDPGVRSCTVMNPAPGGGVSNAPAFYVTEPGVTVTGANNASGVDPSASVGGATGVTASATGVGTVNVATYNGDPGGAPSFHASGGFMDVQLGCGSAFTALMIVDCDLKGGTQVYWWNGSAWALASDQAYDVTTKCVTITVNGGTSPSLADLTGTPFGAALTTQYVYLPLLARNR